MYTEDGHPVLSLIGQVYSQIAARKYYQSALAGLHYQMSIGSKLAVLHLSLLIYCLTCLFMLLITTEGLV